MKDKVNVLGTEYKIIFNAEEMPDGADGTMNCTNKTIKIAKFVKTPDSVQDGEAYLKQCVRHEIIHAFFFESGVWANSGNIEAWGIDETATDWIALQSPKFLKAFKEVGCL